MKRILLALALVGGAVVFDGRAAQPPTRLLTIPGTTSGAPFDTTPTTVFNWFVEEWNPVRFPQSLDVSTWGKDAGASVTADSALCPLDANGEPMDLVSSHPSTGSAMQSVYQQVFLGSVASGAPVTLAMDFAAPIGTASVVASIRGACGSGNPTILGCTRSDGGACTTTITTTTNAVAYTTLTSTTPVTLALTFTCGAVTSVWHTVQAGQYNFSRGFSVCASNARVARGGGLPPWRQPAGRNANWIASVSSAFDSWTPQNVTIAAPTVVANAATAPDGTLTAERATFPAWTAGSQVSLRYTTVATALGGAGAFSVALRADAPTTAYIMVESGGIGAWKACDVTTAWATCTLYFAGISGSAVPAIGVDSRLSGFPTSGPASTVYVADAKLALYGDAFAATGTVSPVTATGLFPRGTANHRGVGGSTFSDSNYFTFGANSGPTDFTGDFMGCATVVIPTTVTNGVLFGDGVYTAPAQGWYVDYSGGAMRLIQIHGLTGTYDATTGGTATLGGRNSICFGRAGTTIYAKVNGAATGSSAVDGIPSWTAGKFYVGRAGQAAYFSNILIEEVWLTTTPWSEALAQQLTEEALKDGGSDHDYPADANTVLHLRGDAFDGTTWTSPQGALTTVGTVGYSDAWAPTASRTQAVGPFTTANYLATTASDPFDFPGDFTTCFVFDPTLAQPGATGMILSASGSTTSGFDVGQGATGVLTVFPRTNPATSSFATANGNGVGPNVGCVGRSGGTMYVRLNRGTTNSVALAGAWAQPTATATTVGKLAFAASNPFGGTVSAVWASLDAWDEAKVTRIIDRALGVVTAEQQSITNARSTPTALVATRDASVGSLVKQVAASVTPVDGPGIGIWRQSTNGYSYSTSPCAAGNVAQAPWTFYSNTCVNDATTGPDGQPADQFTQTANSGGPYVAGVNLGTNTVVTVSVYGKRVSGTGYIGAMVQCAAGLASCTCSRDDGGACIALSGAAAGAPLTALQCVAKASIDSTRWVRVSATATCSAPTNVFTGAAYPGEPGVTTGDTAYLTDFQIEAGGSATPYINTVASATQRNADDVTVPNPIPNGNANWCVSGTYTPSPGRAWANAAGTVNTLWAMGTTNTIGSARLEVEGSALTFRVWPSAGGPLLAVYPAASLSAGPHTIRACNANGRLAIAVDGAVTMLTAAPSVPTGYAPGAITVMPTTISVGSRVGATTQWDGHVRDFKVERDGLTDREVVAYEQAVALDLPLLASGLPFVEDANTVSHVLWNGTGLIDTRFRLTNLALQSDAIDASPWSVLGLGVAAPVVTPNVIAGPQGGLTADRLDVSATANNTQYSLLSQNLGVLVNGVTYTAEVWLRSVSGAGSIYLTITDFSDVNTGTADCVVSEAWSRCYVTHTRTAGSTSYLLLGTDARRTSHADVRPAVSVYVAGAQLHAGGYTTAYVPTTTAAATGSVVANETHTAGAWMMNGTVPQVAAAVLPTVVGAVGGAGPYTDTNYYSSGTGADAADTTGDRYGCASFTVTSVPATNNVLWSNGFFNVAGSYLYVRGTTPGPTNILSFDSRGAAHANAQTANAVTVGGLNVGCWWRTGNVVYVKLNLGTTASADSGGPEVLGSSYSFKVGKYEGTSAFFSSGTILEQIHGVGACPGGCEAWATAQMRRAFGMEGPKGEALANTRSTVGTYVANGAVWTAPPVVVRIEPAGALSETQRTNALFSSGTITSGTALAANWSTLGAPTFSTQGTALDGVGTWARVTSTTIGDTPYQLRALSSNTTITASIWAKADTSTDTVSIASSCVSGTNLACTCGRSDGGPCTARPGVGGTYVCTSDHTIGTTPVRIWSVATCDAAKASAALTFSPGSFQATTGTADFSLAQLEAGPYPTSYIATTSAAVQRNADAISAPAPTVPVEDYAVGIGWKYLPGRAPTTGSYLWSWDNTTGGMDSIAYFASTAAINTRYYNSDGSTFRPTVADVSAHTAGSTHALLSTFSPSRRSNYLDGVVTTDTVLLNRAGTMPTPLYFGGNPSGTVALDANISKFKVCASSDATRCP